MDGVLEILQGRGAHAGVLHHGSSCELREDDREAGDPVADLLGGGQSEGRTPGENSKAVRHAREREFRMSGRSCNAYEEINEGMIPRRTARRATARASPRTRRVTHWSLAGVVVQVPAQMQGGECTCKVKRAHKCHICLSPAHRNSECPSRMRVKSDGPLWTAIEEMGWPGLSLVFVCELGELAASAESLSMMAKR